MDAALDVVSVVLVLIGALLCLTAAIGVARFTDVPTRLHAATKPQVLGLMLICLAIALALRSWPVTAFLVPVVLIQLATAPLSAHMVGRQAYRNGRIDRPSMVVDELADRAAGDEVGDPTTTPTSPTPTIAPASDEPSPDESAPDGRGNG
ncbi:Na+/H+ antiporter subunit G [Microbacterium protaetiae]|uniref:Na+/H+ antiporter subunit G n=1 Tax=Microbacterium protaetiae TaxID=2509458 RepID=A0A4P6ECH3_9MICO|nr:monovalent cation/H(+) antiporter subunit G [Microbacterium protaetiae]QAY59754.1 Na+/H+ antiporter subunit G [Microbacterium protaetiae]